MDFGEVNDCASKHICSACVGEAYLSAEISVAGRTVECDYCGDTAPSISIAELAERVEEVTCPVSPRH